MAKTPTMLMNVSVNVTARVEDSGDIVWSVDDKDMVAAIKTEVRRRLEAIKKLQEMLGNTGDEQQ